MKKIMTLIALMTIVFTANALPRRQAMAEALSMTDRMNHELRLSRHQYDKVLRINTDYMLSVGTRDEGRANIHRQHELERVLTVDQLRHLHHRKAATWRNHPQPHHNGHAPRHAHGSHRH